MTVEDIDSNITSVEMIGENDQDQEISYDEVQQVYREDIEDEIDNLWAQVEPDTSLIEHLVIG